MEQEQRATRRLMLFFAIVFAVEPRAGGMQLTNEVTIDIDGQTRPACIAETIGIVFR